MSNFSVESKGMMSVTTVGGSPDPVGVMDISGGASLALTLDQVVGVKGHGAVTVKRMDTGATIYSASCKGGENVSEAWSTIVSGGLNLNGTTLKVEWSFGGTVPSQAQILANTLATDLTGSYSLQVFAQGNGYMSGQALYTAPAGY